MTALTRARNTAYRSGDSFNHPVAAAVAIYAGALIMATATGFAKPGVTATGLVPLGRAEEDVDNSAGGDGDVVITVSRSIFKFANDGSITRAHLEKTLYVVDDQTLAATDGTGTRSAAGKLMQLDEDGGVWVDLR